MLQSIGVTAFDFTGTTDYNSRRDYFRSIPLSTNVGLNDQFFRHMGLVWGSLN